MSMEGKEEKTEKGSAERVSEVSEGEFVIRVYRTRNCSTRVLSECRYEGRVRSQSSNKVNLE